MQANKVTASCDEVQAEIDAAAKMPDAKPAPDPSGRQDSSGIGESGFVNLESDLLHLVSCSASCIMV
jgi:hypothetical protein